MWLLLSVLLAHPAENPRYLEAFTTRDACIAAASRANGPTPEQLMQAPRGPRIAACFKLVYPA